MAPKKRKASLGVEEGVVASQVQPIDSSFAGQSSSSIASTLLGGSDEQSPAPDAPSENPWTMREKLELLKIHRDYNNYSKVEKANKLHQKMSSLRESNGEPAKPNRSGYEVISMIRELSIEQVTIEQLEGQLGLSQADENPRKKRKKTPVKTKDET